MMETAVLRLPILFEQLRVARGMGRLQLHEYQRDAVDEPHQIGPPGVHLAGRPELVDQLSTPTPTVPFSPI